MFEQFAIPALSWLGVPLPAIHGGGHDGVGGIVGLLDHVLTDVSRALESGADWNPIAGIVALGSNVHPMIVHFPIAFLGAFLVLEIVGLIWRRPGLRSLASGMLYLGALSAVAAAGAGLIAEDSVPHGAAVHDIMEWHERLGLTVAVLSVGLAIWRVVLGGVILGGMAQALHLFLAAIIGVCLFFGADLGGLMVYQYGVGVKNLQQADEHHHHHEEAAAADVHP